jgi:hypothetical protein
MRRRRNREVITPFHPVVRLGSAKRERGSREAPFRGLEKNLERLKLFSLFRRGQFVGFQAGFLAQASSYSPRLPVRSDFRFWIFDFRLRSKIPNPKSEILPDSGSCLRLSLPSQWRDRTGLAPVSLLSLRAPEIRDWSYNDTAERCQGLNTNTGGSPSRVAR